MDSIENKSSLGKGNAIERQLKEVIINLKHYFETKHIEWSETHVINEIHVATKVSDTAVKRIVNEYKITNKLMSPKKKSRKTNGYSFNDSDKQTIESIIKQFYTEKQIPNIKEVYKKICLAEDLSLSFKGCSLGTFQRIFHKMGLNLGPKRKGKHRKANQPYIDTQMTSSELCYHNCTQVGCNERFVTEEELNSHMNGIHKQTNEYLMTQTSDENQMVTNISETSDANETQMNETLNKNILFNESLLKSGNKGLKWELKPININSKPVEYSKMKIMKDKVLEAFVGPNGKKETKILIDKGLDQKTHQFYYKCAKCHQFFETRNHLFDHLKDSHSEYVFDCDLCDYRNHNKRIFETHILSHEEYKFKCQEYGCVHTFTNDMDMELHMNREHKSWFVCNTCNKKFFTERLVTNHLAIAHKIPAFRCHWCHFKTCLRLELLRHMSTHFIEGVFNCDFEDCGQQFDTSESLAQHRIHHFDSGPQN